MNFLRLCCLFLILHTPGSFAGDHLDTSRLIIGFHEKAYMELGGAAEATDYINSQWGDKKMISLVRPMDNSSILVELIEKKVARLNEVIDDLSQMPKVRFVEKDQMVDFMQGNGLGIPSINN